MSLDFYFGLIKIISLNSLMQVGSALAFFLPFYFGNTMLNFA